MSLPTIGRRKKELPMVEALPTLSNGASPSERYQQGLAEHIATITERDALAAKVQQLQIELQGVRAECAALKNMLTFSEEQERLFRSEADSRVQHYRNERDEAYNDMISCGVKFEDMFASFTAMLQQYGPFLATIRERRVTGTAVAVADTNQTDRIGGVTR